MREMYAPQNNSQVVHNDYGKLINVTPNNFAKVGITSPYPN
jgi:hypothetical protein